MFVYKMSIRYDGAKYKGWQRLGNTDKTIQGKIESVMSKLLEEKVEITGASRTDAGVHAICQVASFHCDAVLDCEQLLKDLNKYLPEDIEICTLDEEDTRFHSRYNAKGKTYLYQIWNGEKVDPFRRQYYAQVEMPLDVKLMRKAATYFVGEHDFTTFTTAKAKKKSMVRNIRSIDIVQEEKCLYIRITGDGFLHNQVRRMVGVLIDIGMKRRMPEVVKTLLLSKDRAKCGVTAPALGLFLEKIYYE